MGWGGWEGDIERKYTVTFFFLGVADGDVLEKKNQGSCILLKVGGGGVHEHITALLRERREGEKEVKHHSG